MRQTYVFNEHDRNKFHERWNECVNRLKRSGFDLSTIVIVCDEREGNPFKAAERGK